MQVKYSILCINNVVCCAFKINSACLRTSVFCFAIRSRDIHYDKHNFLLKSAFIARHETRNFKRPLDMLNDYVNGAVNENHAEHA